MKSYDLTQMESETLANLAAREHNRLLKAPMRKGERMSERALQRGMLKGIIAKLRGESLEEKEVKTNE